MALTRYQWNTAQDLIAQMDVASNSFGRQDATLYANRDSDNKKLAELVTHLEARSLVAYPDIKDGKQVLTVYGFNNPNHLINILKQDGFVSSSPAPTEAGAPDQTSEARKFIDRYSIQLAAASGLLGHASMYALAAKTGNKNFYGTAASYTIADGMIAAYGTDKSTTADPIMQDFKRYLWEQGIDNRFVKADTSSISIAQSADGFMKKYGFQVANAFGASGNVGMVLGGLQGSQKDWSMVAAGATSLFGAGLQIFGTEEKVDPEQAKRQSLASNIIGFVNANPMQIAAATNFADPLLLTTSALMTNSRNRATIAENTKQIHSAQASLLEMAAQGELNLKSLPEGIRNTIEKERSLVSNITDLRNRIEKMEGPKFKGWGPIGQIAESIRELRGPQTKELKALYSELQGFEKQLAENSLFIGEGAADLHKLLKGHNIEEAGKIANQIKKWQEEIHRAHKGGKVEPYIRGLVAAFYGSATVIRFIARKTATVDQNRDAFSEVYAAAAESLLNIEDPAQRESMLVQFGHYLSTHPKMKEPSDVILEKIRERVDTFEQSPFVQQPHHTKTHEAPIEPAETPGSHVIANSHVKDGKIPVETTHEAHIS